MSTGTKIEWTGATWNPVVGCSRASRGCDHCYAVGMTHRLEGMGKQKYAGLTVLNGRGERHFNGTVRCVEDELTTPLRWKTPRRVFVCSMSDLFHPKVPFGFIARVFDVMCSWRWPSKRAEREGNAEDLVDPGHTYQLLTKRPERVPEFLDWVFASWPGDSPFNLHLSARRGIAPDIWLGCSAEDQATLDKRLPHLLRCPAAVRWLSLEPLLGPIDLGLGRPGGECLPELRHHSKSVPLHTMIGWVVGGGESGPGARECEVGWIRSIVRQCHDARVPVFVKQLGARPVNRGDPCWDGCDCGLHHGFISRKGGDPDEWPEDLRVREYPAGGGDGRA